MFALVESTRPAAAGGTGDLSSIECCVLHLDCERSAALVGGREVKLTPRECEILSILVARRDKVVLRTELHALVWNGPARRRDRSADVLIRRVRLKLEEAAPRCRFIHTHHGLGYRYSPEPAPEA